MTAFKYNVRRHQDKRMAAQHLRVRALRRCFAAVAKHRLSRTRRRGKLSVAVSRLTNLAAGRAFTAWKSFAVESADHKRKVGKASSRFLAARLTTYHGHTVTYTWAASMDGEVDGDPGPWVHAPTQ